MTFLPLYLQLTQSLLSCSGWEDLRLKSKALVKVATIKLVSVSGATISLSLRGILYHYLTLAGPNVSNNIQRSGGWLAGY